MLTESSFFNHQALPHQPCQSALITVSFSVARHDAWLNYTSSPSRTRRQCSHILQTRDFAQYENPLFIACFTRTKKKKNFRQEAEQIRTHPPSSFQPLRERERERGMSFPPLTRAPQIKKKTEKCTYRPTNSELGTRVYTVKQSAKLQRSCAELREGEATYRVWRHRRLGTRGGWH